MLKCLVGRAMELQQVKISIIMIIIMIILIIITSKARLLQLSSKREKDISSQKRVTWGTGSQAPEGPLYSYYFIFKRKIYHPSVDVRKKKFTEHQLDKDLKKGDFSPLL